MDAFKSSKSLRRVWDDAAFILVSRGHRIEPRHCKITCLLLRMTVSHTSAKGGFLFTIMADGQVILLLSGFLPYRDFLTLRKTFGPHKGGVIEAMKL
jgi:hypothetical protein